VKGSAAISKEWRKLYDVAFISGVRNPSAIGFKTDEILRVITIDEN
jgi:hypothetical protein